MPVLIISNNDIKRFWSHVDKTETASNNCWNWTLAGGTYGYGEFIVGGRKNRRKLGPHQFSYIVAYGTPNHSVCHKCDNPKCVRPDHLWDGTQKENIQDAARKGRMRCCLLPGSGNPNAKLTEADVIEIRALYPTGLHTQKELALRYGVNESGICNILARRTWRHVP
jgi:HNH endonuclease